MNATFFRDSLSVPWHLIKFTLIVKIEECIPDFWENRFCYTEISDRIQHIFKHEKWSKLPLLEWSTDHLKIGITIIRLNNVSNEKNLHLIKFQGAAEFINLLFLIYLHKYRHAYVILQNNYVIMYFPKLQIMEVIMYAVTKGHITTY